MRRAELLLLLEREGCIPRDRTNTFSLNTEEIYLKLKYYYRKLSIQKICDGIYEIKGKSGFQIIIEEV